MPMDQQQHPPACDGGSFWRCGVNTRYTSTRRSASKTLCDDVEVALVGTTTSSYKGSNTADWVVKAVRALPYFSYRNRFEPLPNGSTHDTHWGCLVRTGQSMLAVGCMKIFAAHAALEPTSSINHVADSQDTHENNNSNNNTEKKTMSSSTTDAGRTSADVWRRWFMDIPTAPLGIHRIEVEAHKQGVSYASWLGPTQLGRALGAVSDALHASKNDDDDVLPPPILCFEGQIVVERLRQALREAGSCLVVLPVALGAKTIDGRYRVVMQRYLRMPTSCGMAGGHGAASVYIAGHQDELIIFTDPHYVQRAYAVPDRPGKLCATPRCLHITKMEPFVLLGFALANEADLTSFLDGIRSANKTLLLPLIMVDEADGAPPSSSS